MALDILSIWQRLLFLVPARGTRTFAIRATVEVARRIITRAAARLTRRV